MGDVLLKMRNIDKIFPGVKALSNVDFTLRAGEIHSLMGENGAGKSTLIKVLTGVYHRDGGTITLNGKEISPNNPKEAQECGISTVYQEVNLCPNLTVAENIFIGREPKKFGFIDWKQINKRSAELLNSLNIHIDVTKTLDHYSVAIQQMIAIARAVDVDAKILILDEPTRGIDVGARDEIYNIMYDLIAKGASIIMISSDLVEVLKMSDRVVVMREGRINGIVENDGMLTQEETMKMELAEEEKHEG